MLPLFSDSDDLASSVILAPKSFAFCRMVRSASLPYRRFAHSNPPPANWQCGLIGPSHLDWSFEHNPCGEAKYRQPKRVALYILVSAWERAEKGWSVEGQEKDIRVGLDQISHDLKIVRLFQDPGFSASTTEQQDRPRPLGRPRTISNYCPFRHQYVVSVWNVSTHSHAPHETNPYYLHGNLPKLYVPYVLAFDVNDASRREHRTRQRPLRR
jgi:hypothetical protein